MMPPLRNWVPSNRSLLWIALLIMRCTYVSLGQGISHEGPLTIFRSDTNETLLSYSFQFNAPATNANNVLTFEFGFGTDEPNSPETFYDSFSATLQNSNQTATALLFTADRSGTEWAPVNAGGLTVNPSDLRYSSTQFPAITPLKMNQFAYLVSFVLPPELTGLISLFFDFFDNLNQFTSLAFVSDVQVRTRHPSSVLALQSSASAAGPFADEAGAVNDTTNKVLTLPLGGTARFFRLRSDSPAVITQLRFQEQDLVFAYSIQPKTFLLQSAATPTGPYVDETNSILDIRSQTVSAPVPSGTRFYRLQSDPPATLSISRQELAGNVLILRYDFSPQFLFLQSSAAADGPFADEAGVAANAAARQLILHRFGQARFFRLRSDQPTHITELSVTKSNLVIHYQ